MDPRYANKKAKEAQEKCLASCEAMERSIAELHGKFDRLLDQLAPIGADKEPRAAARPAKREG